MRQVQKLEAALRVLAAAELEADFAVASMPIGGSTGIWPADLPIEIRTAGDRRRNSFLAGRACARKALGMLGTRITGSIPIGHAGAPAWPNGFVGSISHTDNVAAAIVARSPPFAGIGLDIEVAGGVDDVAMLELICRREEDLADVDAADPARLHHAKLLFVIKEAVYKLHRPLGGEFLEFHDVLVTLHDAGRFVAELVDARKQGAAGPSISGRISRGFDGLAALAVCRTSAASVSGTGIRSDG